MATQRDNEFPTLVESVFDQYGAALRRYLLRCLRRAPQHALDLEQEVYLRIMRVENAEMVRDPQAYMYRIASHVVYEFKQRGRQQHVTFDSQLVDDLAEMPTFISPDQLEDRISAERQLERMLEILPPRCKVAFVLHMRDGMTHAEVAKKLGISVNGVKKHILRAFEALRAEIRNAPWEL